MTRPGKSRGRSNSRRSRRACSSSNLFTTFAANLGEGSVLTWGFQNMAVTAALRRGSGATCSRSCPRVLFLLPFADNSPVLTWRFPEYGGDGSAAQGRQSNVHNIHSSRAAFAAVADEGSVVAAHPSVRVCMCYFAWRWICCDLERSTPLQRRQKFLRTSWNACHLKCPWLQRGVVPQRSHRGACSPDLGPWLRQILQRVTRGNKTH